MDSVKKFYGRDGEKVDQWFDRYQVIVDMAELSSDAVKMLPLFLEDAAYSTWSLMDETAGLDLASVRREFQRVFGTTKLTAWQELKASRIFPGESVDITVEKMKSLLRTITGEKTNKHLVALFLLGVLPEKLWSW